MPAWLALWLACLSAAAPAVDTLDYFLQIDDAREQWTIGGHDVLPALDPDGTGRRTVILAKWHSPDSYEVYRLTDDAIELRYEVVRAGGRAGTGNWVRRFEEVGTGENAPGAHWLRRRMVPGDPPFLSTFAQDRLVYDPQQKAYVVQPQGGGPRMQVYQAVVWAEPGWGERNVSGMDLGRCLRMVSEWKHDGGVFETYDYAKGKGLVNWRLLERVSTLKPLPDDRSGRRFRTTFDPVVVEPGTGEPRVYRCDPATGAQGEALPVEQHVSTWAPQAGAQWYVVLRDLSRESRLERRAERLMPSFLLPEWEARPNASLVDLPYLNTHPPRRP